MTNIEQPRSAVFCQTLGSATNLPRPKARTVFFWDDGWACAAFFVLSSLERCPRPEEHAEALAGGHPGRLRGRVFSGEKRSSVGEDGENARNSGHQAGWMAS